MPFSTLTTAAGPILGTQLFINREDSPDQVRGWLRQIAAARLKVVRLFVYWDMVNPAPDVWQWDAFDAAFDEAAALGLGIVPTPFAQCPPGWMRLTTNNQSVGDLEDPALWSAARDYLRRCVERWRDHPALDSWIVWNEASMNVPRTPATLGLFRAWLARRYGHDIARYNRQYYRQFTAFEQIDFEPTSQLSPIPSRTEAADWLDYTIDHLTEKIRVLTADIRALDPRHPVHVNPHLILEARSYGCAQSIWSEARVVDFLGCSIHPVWHCTRFPLARRDRAVAMINDLIRSATPAPDAYYWVSELQGGPALFSGFEANTPTPADLHAWLWESVAAGAKAVVFWCFNQRTSGGEGGEWNLLDQRGRPSRRLHAATRVAEQIALHAPLLAAARPPRTLVKILHSEASWRLASLEGSGSDVTNPRNTEAAADATAGAYELLTALGHEVGFIDEYALAAGGPRLDETRVLVLPGCTALAAETVASLAAFTARGGFVIADGLAGWKDPAAWVNAHAEPLAALFGADLADIEAHPGTLPLTFAAAALPAPFDGWLVRASFDPRPGATVLARWDDDTAAIVRSPHALRIGTNFFQRHFAFPTDAARDWLATQLGDLAPEPFTLLAPPPGLRLRRLAHTEGDLAVIINSGPATTARIRIRTTGEIRTLPIPATDAAVLLA